MSKKMFLALAIAGLLIGVAIGITLDYFRLPTIGVYGEYGLTFTPNQINWNDVYLEVPVTRQVTMQNTGTRPFANLTAYYGNETANLYNYTLTWDGEDYALAPGESLLVNFTLIIYNATAGSFGFDIYVSDKG